MLFAALSASAGKALIGAFIAGYTLISSDKRN